jgi:hypothetical protein
MIVTASSVAVNNPASSVVQHAGSAEKSTVPKVRESKPRKPRRPNSATALEQAIALGNSLRRQAAKAGELACMIKRQRREANLLKSPFANLMQFQAAGWDARLAVWVRLVL